MVNIEECWLCVKGRAMQCMVVAIVQLSIVYGSVVAGTNDAK